MPKRVVDGDALWRSRKLLLVPIEYRAEYANLVPLADVNGSFECDPASVWSDVYAFNRSNISPDDVAAMLAYADQQSEIKRGPAGCHGYCMSGPYALAAAARYPDRIATAASFYGTRLVSEAEESPHLSLSKVKGELYIACAEHDALAPCRWSRSYAPVWPRVHRRRDRALPRRPSRLRLPAAVVLRQAGRGAPLGAADRALSAAPRVTAEPYKVCPVA